MSYAFSTKRPSKTRKSFAIHRKIKNADGTYSQPQIKNPILDAINKNFKDGVLDFNQANLQVLTLVKKLKAELADADGVVLEKIISEDNKKVLNGLMKVNYSGKDIKRPALIDAEFAFALKGIEPLSIISSSQAKLQSAVSFLWNAKQSKRYVGRLNQLLKFAGRDFKLHFKKPIHNKVSYVSWDDFVKIRKNVKDSDLKNLYTFLFCTGVRLGEAFVIRSGDLKPNGTIYISHQMTEKRVVRVLKNGKPHHTYRLDFGKTEIEKWAALSIEEKEKIRTRCQHAILYAARATFSDKEKHVSCHDLRHSYVIHMLGQGIPLDKCAKLIGDSIKTTEMYYAGFSMSSEEIDVVAKILKKNKKS
jgi:integrase